MPTTTPRYGWTTASLTDPPNGPSDESTVALAIESTVGALDDRTAPMPKGRIGSGSRSGASSNFGTTETVVDTLTVTLVSGRRYRFYLDAGIVGVTGGNVNYGVQFRYQSGATLTTSGTSFRATTTQLAVSGNFEPRHFGAAEFVAPSSGQFTIGWTLKMTTTGTVRSDGGTYWHLDDIGV